MKTTYFDNPFKAEPNGIVIIQDLRDWLKAIDFEGLLAHQIRYQVVRTNRSILIAYLVLCELQDTFALPVTMRCHLPHNQADYYSTLRWDLNRHLNGDLNRISRDLLFVPPHPVWTEIVLHVEGSTLFLHYTLQNR